MVIYGDLKIMIEKVVELLEEAYPYHVDLLIPFWKNENYKAGVSSVGFCYLGAEAAYHLLGGKEAGWKPYYAVYYEDGNRCTHWWIEKDGVIVDPTKTQYTAFEEECWISYETTIQESK
jgi:hypothetical protein